MSDNKQHSQQTDIHAPGGIRTRSLSRRAAADPHSRQRGHWDRHLMYVLFRNCVFVWYDYQKICANIRMHEMENFKIYFCLLCGIQVLFLE